MEHTLLETVGMLGFDFICIATLVLFGLHAIETWRVRRTERDTRRTVDAVEHRVHHFPRAQSARTDEHDQEPTRRAA